MKNKTSNKVSLLVLLKETLNEIGDLNNIEPFPYILTSYGGTFDIEIPNYGVIDVRVVTEDVSNFKQDFHFPPIINPEGKELINIAYSIDGTDSQFAKTNISLLMRILKTISEMINEILVKYEDPLFIIMASDKFGGVKSDPQKFKFYKLILRQNMPSGWRIGEGKYIPYNQETLYLTKAK
jgi:hypothetical protein